MTKKDWPKCRLTTEICLVYLLQDLTFHNLDFCINILIMKVNIFSQSHTEVLQRNVCILILNSIQFRSKQIRTKRGRFYFFRYIWRALDQSAVSIIPKEIYDGCGNENRSLDEVGPGISYITMSVIF